MLKAGNLNLQNPNNREVYLDLAKFFAMIMMVAGHSFFEIALPESYNFDIFPWSWWNFARGKTAPMFLFLSGAVHVFANFKNSTTGISNHLLKKRIGLALMLLAIGYILNSPINSINDIFNITDEKLYVFYQVNILHIFGIGLFFLALVYKFSRSPNQVLIYCFSIALLSSLVAPIFIHSGLSFLPLFIRDYLNYFGGSIFVLFPYISYLFFGSCFGIISWRIIQKTKNNETVNTFIEKAFKGKYFALSAFILIILGSILTKIMIYYGLKLDIRSDIGTLFRNIGIILAVLFLMKNIRINSQFFRKFITILSKRAIYIYVIHLFIIYGIGNIHGLKYYYGNSFSTLTAFGVSLGVIISSIILTLLIDYSIRFKTIKYYLFGAFILYWVYFILQ